MHSATDQQTAALPRLNREFLRRRAELAGGDAIDGIRAFPERVLQFGEGNFLRAFADWMIAGLNRRAGFAGQVAVVQPIARGMVRALNEQDGLYTLCERGIEGGRLTERRQVVTSVSRGIDPYTDFEAFLGCAHNPDLRFIVSNTTEAGIGFSDSDAAADRPPASFPGKLTALLHQRFRAFDGDVNRGLVLLPCELIDRNGDRLKETVLQTARHWNAEGRFLDWVEHANVFTNTLVDRIVPGYPKDEAAAFATELGYRDDLLDTCEAFHFWAIEGPPEVRRELPLTDAGFNVTWTENLRPYRDRKVRILNGAHTSLALAAFLAGKETVGECMDEPAIRGFLEAAIFDEIVPVVQLNRQELETFAAAVLERFSNPFLQHSLLSIALNSVSKYRARVLPSVEDYIARFGIPPARLAFALAALIVFYRGAGPHDGALTGSRGGRPYRIIDDVAVLEAFARLWDEFPGGQDATGRLAGEVLQRTDWWGRDLRQLDGFADAVTSSLEQILSHGMLAAMSHHS